MPVVRQGNVKLGDVREPAQGHSDTVRPPSHKARACCQGNGTPTHQSATQRPGSRLRLGMTSRTPHTPAPAGHTPWAPFT